MWRAIPLLGVVVAACGGSTSPEGGGTIAAPSLFIRDVLSPPAPYGEGICLYTSDPSQPALSSGTLDVMFATKYAPAILVGNIADGGDAGDARGAITGFDVTVTDASGATIGSFHSDAAGFVEGAYGGTPSYAAVSGTLLDSATVAAARIHAGDVGTTHVVAHASATGRSASGGTVKSIPLDFPIDLCDGCLVSFPPDVGPTRSGCGAPPTASFAQPCVVGQDQPIDCRLCYATHPACRP